MFVCVQGTNNTADMYALHSFNSTHHYEFTLYITNVTESDLHRYDLEVSNDLGTTVGSLHVLLGQCTTSAMLVIVSGLARCVCLSVCSDVEVSECLLDTH